MKFITYFVFRESLLIFLFFLLQLTCSPGETVRQVIEKEIPQISRTAYQVYQFPSRALLNPAKDASVLQDQEIWIEPTHVETPGNH